VRKDARNGQRPAALGDGRSPHPGTLAAALEFIHTNNSPNPILRCFPADLRPVYASEKGSRIQLKRLPDHGLAPATWVAWCVT
jgi:hypothetical protein